MQVRFGSIAGGALLVAALGLVGPASAGETKGDAPLHKAGDVAPRFGPVRLHNPEKAGMPTFILGRFAGENPETPAKGVQISFFATWCGPCKKELPFLVELDRKYRDKGLKVVSISIDKEKEAFEQIRALVEEHDVRFPVLMDRYNLLARRYLGEKTAMPSVFLVRTDGTIALVKQGYDEDASAFLTAEVEKLLGG